VIVMTTTTPSGPTTSTLDDAAILGTGIPGWASHERIFDRYGTAADGVRNSVGTWRSVDARWPHEIALSVLVHMRYLADAALNDAQWGDAGRSDRRRNTRAVAPGRPRRRVHEPTDASPPAQRQTPSPH
jgi:hypothetical protein